jgi:hypothetical protein
MRYLSLVLLASCAGSLPPPSGSCGVMAAGNFEQRFKSDGLTDEIVEDMVKRALNGTTFTTDWRLSDQTENCRMLQGYNVYTRPPGAFTITMSDGRPLSVTGYTTCWQKLIVVAAPGNGVWRQSALIHELFHAMQNCKAPRPVDIGGDPDHSNWARDNIYWSIDAEMDRP